MLKFPNQDLHVLQSMKIVFNLANHADPDGNATWYSLLAIVPIWGFPVYKEFT